MKGNEKAVTKLIEYEIHGSTHKDKNGKCVYKILKSNYLYESNIDS